MAATSASVTRDIFPGPAEVRGKMYQTAATADSGDELDVSADFGTIYFCTAWDNTTGDQVTVTNAAGTLTIDNGGGTADHAYTVLVFGNPATS